MRGRKFGAQEPLKKAGRQADNKKNRLEPSYRQKKKKPESGAKSGELCAETFWGCDPCIAPSRLHLNLSFGL